MPWQDASGPGDAAEAKGNSLLTSTSMADNVRIAGLMVLRVKSEGPMYLR